MIHLHPPFFEDSLSLRSDGAEASFGHPNDLSGKASYCPTDSLNSWKSYSSRLYAPIGQGRSITTTPTLEFAKPFPFLAFRSRGNSVCGADEGEEEEEEVSVVVPKYAGDVAKFASLHMSTKGVETDLDEGSHSLRFTEEDKHSLGNINQMINSPLRRSVSCGDTITPWNAQFQLHNRDTHNNNNNSGEHKHSSPPSLYSDGNSNHTSLESTMGGGTLHLDAVLQPLSNVNTLTPDTFQADISKGVKRNNYTVKVPSARQARQKSTTPSSYDPEKEAIKRDYYKNQLHTVFQNNSDESSDSKGYSPVTMSETGNSAKFGAFGIPSITDYKAPSLLRYSSSSALAEKGKSNPSPAGPNSEKRSKRVQIFSPPVLSPNDSFSLRGSPTEPGDHLDSLSKKGSNDTSSTAVHRELDYSLKSLNELKGNEGSDSFSASRRNEHYTDSTATRTTPPFSFHRRHSLGVNGNPTRQYWTAGGDSPSVRYSLNDNSFTLHTPCTMSLNSNLVSKRSVDSWKELDDIAAEAERMESDLKREGPPKRTTRKEGKGEGGKFDSVTPPSPPIESTSILHRVPSSSLRINPHTDDVASRLKAPTLSFSLTTPKTNFRSHFEQSRYKRVTDSTRASLSPSNPLLHFTFARGNSSPPEESRRFPREGSSCSSDRTTTSSSRRSRSRQVQIFSPPESSLRRETLKGNQTAVSPLIEMLPEVEPTTAPPSTTTTGPRLSLLTLKDLQEGEESKLLTFSNSNSNSKVNPPHTPSRRTTAKMSRSGTDGGGKNKAPKGTSVIHHAPSQSGSGLDSLRSWQDMVEQLKSPPVGDAPSSKQENKDLEGEEESSPRTEQLLQQYFQSSFHGIADTAAPVQEGKEKEEESKKKQKDNGASAEARRPSQRWDPSFPSETISRKELNKEGVLMNLHKEAEQETMPSPKKKKSDPSDSLHKNDTKEEEEEAEFLLSLSHAGPTSATNSHTARSVASSTSSSSLTVHQPSPLLPLETTEDTEGWKNVTLK